MFLLLRKVVRPEPTLRLWMGMRRERLASSSLFSPLSRPISSFSPRPLRLARPRLATPQRGEERGDDFKAEDRATWPNTGFLSLTTMRTWTLASELY